MIDFLVKEEHEYIIATSGNRPKILQHEIAHALYYLDKNYKKEVLKIMKKENLEQIEKQLISLGDYHPDVFFDEVQAYSISGSHHLKTKFPEKMKKQIRVLFKKYIQKHKIKY